MAEWMRWALGITIPLLIGHWVWMTLTVLRMRQTLYGEGGTNGIKGDVGKLRVRCHDLANTVQGVSGTTEVLEREIEYLKNDRLIERRKLPKRGG
jgi:hypothetical protein